MPERGGINTTVFVHDLVQRINKIHADEGLPEPFTNQDIKRLCESSQYYIRAVERAAIRERFPSPHRSRLKRAK